MPPKVEPLSNVDAAWLGMEDPTNLMMVSGVMTFEEPINFEHLKAVLQYRLLKFDRFRKRVVQPRLPLANPYWETDPNFDINAHLHRIALPEPGDQTTLQNVASDLMSTPLDFSKPPWQIHLIENFGDGCAVMSRLHHCIADGIALMFVLLALADMSPDAPWPEPDDSEPEEDDGPFHGALGALFKQATNTVRSLRNVTGRAVQEGLEAMVIPAKMLDLALEGADNAVAASRLVLRSPDPKTMFKGKLGVAKQATWSRPLPLKEIKAIKNVTGGTVNDVLVSAMTGALRRYLINHEQPVAGLNFRAAVPVNIRKQEEMNQLGNKFGLVFLSLPVGIGDALERLKEVNKRMSALKNSPEAFAAFGILNAIGMSPAEVQSRMVDMFGAKATAVMTNVPGPPVPLYLAGSKIDGIMFWVPQSGRLGLGISIISYANKVWLGVATDAGLIPNPNEIIDGFYEEYEALLALVRTAEAVAGDETSPEKDVAAAAPPPEADPDRCQAITQSGRRCRNRAQKGSDYCHIHQKQAQAA